MLPPDVLQLARLHRLRQQELVRLALDHTRRGWALLDAGDIPASWARLAGPQLLQLVTTAQAEAARGVQRYVTTSIELTGHTSDPAGVVPSWPFAGVASDGRPLDTLLGQPAIAAQNLVEQGLAATDALGAGARMLERIVATQIQDAARVATGVAVVNDRTVQGYIRMLNPPSCSRCVILAGKRYRYNHGFARHPNCDCVHMPTAEVIEAPSPKALFEAMTPAQLKAAGWSAADVQAINDGADIYQVTNARRELRSVSVAGRQVQTTTSGVTRRGLAGQRLGARNGTPALRLTPEAIYAEAQRLRWSREETIAALKRFGYIL